MIVTCQICGEVFDRVNPDDPNAVAALVQHSNDSHPDAAREGAQVIGLVSTVILMRDYTFSDPRVVAGWKKSLTASAMFIYESMRRLDPANPLFQLMAKYLVKGG